MSETVVIARIKHETNTFSSLLTDYDEFEATSLFFSDEIISEFQGTNTDIGGFLRVADEEDWEIKPTIAANATPGGIVKAEALDRFIDSLLDGIREYDPDSVLLGLHGAMVSERDRDGDGYILERVHEAAGEDTPVMATLDLHANITDRMTKYADGLFGYDTYPHIDIGDTGETAARAMAATLNGDFEPTIVVERAPLLLSLPVLQTANEPMRSLLSHASKAESSAIPDVSVFGGFAYADVPEAGFSVVAVTDRSRTDETRSVCADIAGEARNRRQEFNREYMSVDEVTDEVRSWDATDGPLLLADIADNPGGGSAEDGTTILKTLLDAGVKDVAVAAIYDPAAVEAATSAGVGERVSVDLGGHVEANGDPLSLDARVRLLSDGTYRNQGPMSTGLEVSFGQTAVLEVDDVNIIVGSHRQQPYDPEVFRSHGIAPERQRVLILKSTVHYRAAFESLVGGIREVSAPGLCSPDLLSFEYKNLERPKWPFDAL